MAYVVGEILLTVGDDGWRWMLATSGPKPWLRIQDRYTIPPRPLAPKPGLAATADLSLVARQECNPLG